jgi:hypothetical protein
MPVRLGWCRPAPVPSGGAAPEGDLAVPVAPRPLRLEPLESRTTPAAVPPDAVLDPAFGTGGFAVVDDTRGFADLAVGPNGAAVAVTVAGAYAAPVANFFIGIDADRNGVRVAALDADGDGRADLIAEPGDGGPARVYRGRDLAGPGEPANHQDLDPLGPLPVEPGLA